MSSPACMHAQKATSGVDYDALVQRYGPEGADHMLHIAEITAAKQQRNGGYVVNLNRPRGSGNPKAPRNADVDAVNALPEGMAWEGAEGAGAAGERPEDEDDMTYV